MRNRNFAAFISSCYYHHSDVFFTHFQATPNRRMSGRSVGAFYQVILFLPPYKSGSHCFVALKFLLAFSLCACLLNRHLNGTGSPSRGKVNTIPSLLSKLVHAHVTDFIRNNSLQLSSQNSCFVNTWQ